ncbi:MAG: hypothetical protein F6K23_12690 [Okeania sp. SIO2C9]|uniref:nuclear transport factor 2 family protein n=1 Tax=Okeania sp. SIO2C9 TaxID=2607791 RepID=UPI0013C275DC|nr:nuclear transport factor 2 family protein [Okeania sp. SIO2C9]NEQ73828.1 hypothetical protein [Okeania sp. SIO2C9]
MAMALEVVKKVYKCFTRGDLDGFVKLCSEDIEWVVNGPSTLEKCQAFHGISGVRKFLDILADSWEFNSFEPRSFFEDDVTVVVLGEETGVCKASGEPFQNRWAHVFKVENEHIVSFQEFLCHWTAEQKPPAMNW